MSDYDRYLMSDDETWEALVSCVSRDDRKGVFGLINVYCDKIIMARRLCEASVDIATERERFLRRERKVSFSELFEDDNEQEE